MFKKNIFVMLVFVVMFQVQSQRLSASPLLWLAKAGLAVGSIASISALSILGLSKALVNSSIGLKYRRTELACDIANFIINYMPLHHRIAIQDKVAGKDYDEDYSYEAVIPLLEKVPEELAHKYSCDLAELTKERLAFMARKEYFLSGGRR